MNKPFPIVATVLVAIVSTILAAASQILARYGLSAGGHVALAMVLIATILWLTEVIPLFVTSLLILVMAVVWLAPTLAHQGVNAPPALFYDAFASDVIFLFLGSFSLSHVCHEFSLDRWTVNKLLGGRTMPFHWLMLALMGITAFLSFWLSNSATAALMLGLVLPIVGNLDPYDPGRKSLILSVPFAANIGGLGTPISSPPNAIAMDYMQQQGFEPSFLKWVLIALPGVVGLIVVGWLLLLILFRPKEKSVTFTADAVRLPSGWRVPAVIILLFATIIGWVTSPYHGINNGMIAMIPFAGVFGLKLLEKDHLPRLSWDVLLLMGGGLCLGIAVKESGLASWVISLLPMDRMTPYQLMLALVTGGVLISSVMSNTAAASLILPIVVMLSVPNPTLFTLAITFTCTMAIPLPISTPPNAIAFSTGEISVRDMAKAGVLMTLLAVALTITLGYAYWLLLEQFL